MFTFYKPNGTDFTVLNISDPQLMDPDWEEDSSVRKILVHTVTKLIDRVQPDLITVSGDLAWAGHIDAYKNFVCLMESFKLPWAPVFGNHDQQDGQAFVDKVVDLFNGCKYCCFKEGNKALGSGNFIINIKNDDNICESLIMMNTHDRMPFVNELGEETLEWARFIPEQVLWYEETVAELKRQGSKESVMIFHIPLFCYREAFDTAFNYKKHPSEVTVDESYTGEFWNEGYKDSFGVQYNKGVSSYPADIGMFDAVKRLGHTKTTICGHNHENNTVINYEGVRLAFSLKCGAGSHYNENLSGGTVIKIDDNGVKDLYHEYIKPCKEQTPCKAFLFGMSHKDNV